MERAGEGILNRMIQDEITPLCFMCKHGGLEASRFLLDEGADMNLPGTADGSSPLSLASENGHCAVVMERLERGAQVSTRNDNNETPLGLAYENGHVGVMYLLLRKSPHVWPGLRPN